MRLSSSYSILPSLASARTSTLADLKLDAVVPIPDKVAKVTVFPPPTVTLEDARLTRDPVNPVESPIVVLPIEETTSPI